MPSAMQSPPVFGKKKSSKGSMSGKSAAEYLAALAELDSKSRKSLAAKGSTPSSTPALSFSSSVTRSTSDSGNTSNHSSRFTPGTIPAVSVAGIDEDVDDGTGLTVPINHPTSTQVFSTVHAQFGHCDNEQHRHTSGHPFGAVFKHPEELDPPYYILFTTYISYLWLICLGHLRDFFGKRAYPEAYGHIMAKNGYAALNSDFDSFYTRRLKHRMEDCFSHPVTGVPGRTVLLLDRTTEDFNDNFKYPGSYTRVLNVSSYNYLGFAQSSGGCADAVEESIRKYGMSSGSSRLEAGTLDLHQQAEALVARFVGMESSIITSMGFATNSTTLSVLTGKGSLVISDEFNHASIRYGVRLSGAQVRMFKHNDVKDLENLLKEVISQGQPKTHRPWKKILVVVEGLYSMEGTLLDLPAVVELKQKYKFYLYVDEAHSIGAIGPHGRGICDYFGVNPRSVDILMGTFTKSFGAAGGYVSGSKAIIDAIRLRTHAGPYAEAMSPVVLTQVLASMSSIMGVRTVAPLSHKHSSSSTSTLTSGNITEDEMQLQPYTGPASSTLVPAWMPLTPEMRSGFEGRERLQRLAFNTRYLARGLKKLGFITYGHPDSPIVPLLLFNPGKMCTFSRLMLERKTPIIVVVVAYPATPLVTSRVRFCLSASHIKSDIDTVLLACDEIGDMLDLKHASGERWSYDKIISNAVTLVNEPDE